jgi:hypothetical protein
MDVEETLEWGGFDLQNGLLQFRYETLLHCRDGVDKLLAYHQGDNEHQNKGVHTSSFAECIGVSQFSTPEDAIARYSEQQQQMKQHRNETILILGCGNSKFGEQLLMNSFVGPILQIDVSSKIINLMSMRYEKYMSGASVKRMELIVDDARRLTAVCPNSVGGGVIDKGLIDVLHCSLGMLPSIQETSSIKTGEDDILNPIQQIVDSVHRVLQPSRPFIFFSRSEPEYILQRTLGTDHLHGNSSIQKKWKDIQVLKMLDLGVLLYRFAKAEPIPDDDAKKKKKGRP